MKLQDFYQMLFIILGAIGVCLIFSELFEFIRSRIHKRYTYYRIKRLWEMLYEENNEESKNQEYSDAAANLVKEECERLFKRFIVNDKYLNKMFFSPKDLLINVISTGKKMKHIENDISVIHNLTVFNQYIEKPDEEKHVNKVQLFEKINAVGTIIGIIVAIAELFL